MQIAKHPNQVFRVGRDPWSIRAPRANNRFDILDPEEPVMTIYTGESPEASWAEVLAPFRPDLETIALVNQIPCDVNKTPVSGKIPKQWPASRRMGTAKINPIAMTVPQN